MVRTGGIVLYVEDDDGDRFFMKRAFDRCGLGAHIRMVGDGRSAIEYLAGAAPYDDRTAYPEPEVVLLDLNLPELSGFEVLDWIRAHHHYAGLPVVIFSSSSSPQDHSKAKDLGADDFWQKPGSSMDYGQIVAALRERWIVRSAAATTVISGK